MFAPNPYTITIRRAEFDGETLYQAKVEELPDIVEYAESHEEAYALVLDCIETTAQAFAEQGRQMPGPCNYETQERPGLHSHVKRGNEDVAKKQKYEV